MGSLSVFGHCFEMVSIATDPFPLVSGTVESRNNVLSTIVRRKRWRSSSAWTLSFVDRGKKRLVTSVNDVSEPLIRYDDYTNDA